jgi:putative oxidoreductase
MATHVRSFDDVATPSTSGKVFHTLTTTVARAAFALPFAVFGLFHFLNAQAMAAVVPIPGGVLWVYLTGLALIAGSLGILTGKLGRLAALGLAALLLTFIVTVHLPGLGNPQMAQMATMGLLKDVSLLGGALTWAGVLGRRT